MAKISSSDRKPSILRHLSVWSKRNHHVFWVQPEGLAFAYREGVRRARERQSPFIRKSRFNGVRMSNKNPKKDPAVPSDNFDPTRRDDDDTSSGQSDSNGALVPRHEQRPAMFGDFIPSGRELSVAAHQTFGKELSEDIVRTIVHESEEIAHSTRRIMEEHMRIGGSVMRIMERVHNHMITRLGDTRQVRDKAAKLVYDYVEKVFRRKRSTIKLYMQCYSKFASNAEAVQILG
jgi:hypothetical protein